MQIDEMLSAYSTDDTQVCGVTKHRRFVRRIGSSAWLFSLVASYVAKSPHPEPSGGMNEI
jgi:hypothetical protein